MKLQILIPQYKETDLILNPLLDSIALQQSVPMDEIGVIICNDGSDTFLTDDFLNSYPFVVEYHKEPHRGVSATRNACLDYATADYVMFCDADDMFYNMCGLWIVFREMVTGFDSLVSMFVEETRNPETKQVEYINHEMDSTFVHGKVHRRQYLIDKKIRFNDNLTIHEDSFFNILVQTVAGEMKYTKNPFYLWRWRDDSVCRHDPEYILKTYNNLLDSNSALVEEFSKRGMESIANQHATQMVYEAYFTLNKKEWIDQKNQDYRYAVEKHFKEYYLKYKKRFEATPENLKNQIIVGIKNRMFKEGMYLEEVTFSDWIKKIKKLK